MMRFTKYAAAIATAGALVLAGCSGGGAAPRSSAAQSQSAVDEIDDKPIDLSEIPF